VEKDGRPLTKLQQNNNDVANFNSSVYLPLIEEDSFCLSAFQIASPAQKAKLMEELEKVSHVYSPLNSDENRIFCQVLAQEEAGDSCIASVSPLDGFGNALILDEDSSKGTVIASYAGTLRMSAECPNYPEPGHDCVFQLFQHKHNDNMSISIDPYGEGGIAHFALSASPKGDDFRYVNSILAPKEVTRVDEESGEVYRTTHLFLVLIKDVKAGTPIVWFYSHGYFENMRESMKSATPVWKTVAQAYEMKGIDPPCLPVFKRKRGRPKETSKRPSNKKTARKRQKR
jgi:hypothetical protein